MLATLVLGLLACQSTDTPQISPKGEKSIELFNGKDLDGWQQFASKKALWKVEDGMIVCQGNGAGWLGTKQQYSDFELSLEYRLQPSGNSGIYIRAPKEGHISRVGMEIQLLDDLHAKYAKLHFYQYTGSVYHVIGPRLRSTKAAGQWNQITIRAKGDHIQVWLNGPKIVDANLAVWRGDLAIAKEHPGISRTTGHIGLQSHTDRVEFRNIKLTPLN